MHGPSVDDERYRMLRKFMLMSEKSRRKEKADDKWERWVALLVLY